MTEVRTARAAVSSTGGVVAAVEPGSLAESAEIRPADRLMAINGRRLRDVIDYEIYSSEDVLTLDLQRDGATLTIELEKDAGLPLGLRFEDPTFDRLRTCNNNCPFCFLKGLPKGLRRSLYIKDDDYRYSFLYGNFVTLTNLTEDDWARVFEQRLSPLYVSVHATEPEVRRQLLGNPKAPEVMPQVDSLAKAGLQIHTQVVLCAGQNDGEHLDATIRDLSSRYPTVQSIGVVPVGLTPRQTDLLARDARATTVVVGPADKTLADRHGCADNLTVLRTTTHCERVVPSAVRLYAPEEARQVVEQVGEWQRRLRKEAGKTLVYLADEFYLLAGKPFPSGRYYDGYPQYENGIGMARTLLDDWSRARKRLASQERNWPRRKAAIVCGLLASELLRPIVAELNELGFDVTLVPVTNRFFGSSITVSGLLTGSDLHASVAGSEFDLIFLPRYMLDMAGARTLDGWTPEEIRADLAAEVVFTTSPAAVVNALTRS